MWLDRRRSSPQYSIPVSQCDPTDEEAMVEETEGDWRGMTAGTYILG